MDKECEGDHRAEDGRREILLALAAVAVGVVVAWGCFRAYAGSARKPLPSVTVRQIRPGGEPR